MTAIGGGTDADRVAQWIQSWTWDCQDVEELQRNLNAIRVYAPHRLAEVPWGQVPAQSKAFYEEWKNPLDPSEKLTHYLDIVAVDREGRSLVAKSTEKTATRSLIHVTEMVVPLNMATRMLQQYNERQDARRAIEQTGPSYDISAEGDEMAGGMAMGKTNGPAAVHDLSHLSDIEAYSETQTNPQIKAGDIIKVKDGVAVMIDAWPTMVVGTSTQFHRLGRLFTWETLDDGKYWPAAQQAMHIASATVNTPAAPDAQPQARSAANNALTSEPFQRFMASLTIQGQEPPNIAPGQDNGAALNAVANKLAGNTLSYDGAVPISPTATCYCYGNHTLHLQVENNGYLMAIRNPTTKFEVVYEGNVADFFTPARKKTKGHSPWNMEPPKPAP